MAIYRGPGGSGDATADSSSEVLLVRQLAVDVQADADAAEAARAAAVVAKNAAETAETNAETAETNAETAETNAETAQAAAASSASGASTSATNAAASASTATTQASNASTSASAASSSASGASTSATNAASSASAASTSATNASNSATAAATSATNASNSATSASTQATNASNSATAASTSASNASTSASAASTSATAASGSASTATTQAGIATTQATNAATSASGASTSATNAASSASGASTSASNASTSATNASNSASAASTSATNASNSASAASTSATNAANSATLAASYTPSQTGNSGKYLTTDGTNTSWDALAAVANSGAYSDLSGTPSLASVATSGSYNDLSNKPTIPTNLDSLTDVTITSPSTDQVLKYNGSAWVNGTAAGGGGFSGATTNAVSSSALTLTNTSTQYQIVQINSVANSIVTLPNATTLTNKGYPPFVIENASPIGANLQVQNSTGAVVGYLVVGQVGLFTLVDNSTSAGLWECSTATTQSFFNYNTASLTTNDFGAGLVGYTGLSATSFLRWGYTLTGWNGQSTGSISGKFQVGTISGNTITFGTAQTFSFLSVSTGTQVYSNDVVMQVIRLSDSSFTIFMGFAYSEYDAGAATYRYAGIKNFRTCTVSGTTITFGSSSTGAVPQNATRNANSGIYISVPYNGTLTRLSDTSFALIFNNAITNTYSHPVNYSGSLAAQIVTVSGTTQTVGTSVALASSTYTNPTSLAAISDTSLFVAYSQGVAGVDLGRTKMNVVSISGTVPTWGTSVTVESADRTVAGSYGAVNYAIASSATQVIFSTAYSVSVASISGTTPTFVATPYFGVLNQLYLTTSSKAYALGGRYLSISAGGFVVSGSIAAVNSSGVNTAPQSPLGATPTTAYITADGVNNMLGNSL